MFDTQKLAEIETRKRGWEAGTLKKALERSPETVEEFAPPPEMERKRIYTPLDIAHLDYNRDLGFPGEYPYTRGIQPTMFRGRRWTMRQISGFGTVEDTNKRFKYLISQGVTGLGVEFDLPTQQGYDSDHPRAQGEVGLVGAACSSLREMETLFHDIPVDRINPAWADNAVAQVLVAMYAATAEKQGVSRDRLTGTSQNDPLKEFIVRGNYIYPVRPSVRLAVDLWEYCTKYMPRWNYTNICGYHIREAGSSLVQEVAFAFADALAYVENAVGRGMNIDDFAPRIAWNFTVFTNIFEEAAKFRAARRLWARMVKERFGAKNQASMMFRTGAGTGGSQLTAQQPENNIVRVTLNTLAAVLGGVQALHTASMDEALALPSAKAATIALRTQQIIAHESGAAEVIDPLAGSYYVEALTDQIEEEADKYIRKIESLGGAVRAIETGWMQKQVADNAYRYQKEIENGQRVVVGVNRFHTEEKQVIELHKTAPGAVEQAKERLRSLKRERDNNAVERALADLRGAAQGKDNLMPYVCQAVESYATVGEICDTLRGVFGEYQPPLF